MRIKIFKNIIFIIMVLSLICSCNGYKKLMKSSDYEKKYEKGLMYYERGENTRNRKQAGKDYSRAQSIFEELRTIFRGTEKAENVAYYYAKSTFEVDEYTLASYLFKDFVRQFPLSSRKEVALFYSAYCYYLLSPEIALDQSDTEIAIQELQYYIEKYPKSDKRAEVEKYIDELQNKLEQKAFNNAMLYFTISDYKAAIVALKNVTIDFPDTKHREEILFTIVKSSFLLAENSISSKQKERYKNTIDSYYIFIDNYPNSKKIKEAEKYYNNSLKFLESKNGL